MANETKKCPMCGTKLKMIDGKMTCNKCGYYVRNQNTETNFQSAPQFNTNRQAGSAQQGSGGYQPGSAQQAGGGYQPRPNYQAVPTQVPKPKQGSEIHPAVILIPVVAVAAVVGLVLVFSRFMFSNVDKPYSGTQAQATTGSKRLEDGAPASSVTDNRRLPRSDFFRNVAEYIWDKDYRNITAEEYASLTAIKIDKEEKTIEYYLEGDENYNSVSYRSDYGMDLADLAAFTGLEWISIDDELKKGDLDGLEYLYGVHTENTIREYLDIIPHPEYITELSIEDGFLERSLSGLESFPSLQYLYIDYSYLEDISVLSQFPNLVELSLTSCSRVTDYSPLLSLTNLVSLNIEASNLKSIDFIKNMPLLDTLGIEAEQLSSLDALGECPALTYLYLYLDDNYSIQDYSVIGELENLVELVLEMGWSWQPDCTLPSFEKLTQLEYLTLKNAKDLSPLKDATGLTYLSLEDCSGWELETIASLQELTILAINDFSSYVDSLEPLTRLPKLMALNLEDTSVFGNIEEIFGIPTLQYLYLDGCQVGIDFDKMPDNESLTELSLNDISILEDPSYNNGGKISLSEHYDMFDHFPNLTSLYMASLEIDNIEFVEKLPYLQYLDITDNNVISLKPLESLPYFEVVWCGKNTILESVSEDSSIWVITED